MNAENGVNAKASTYQCPKCSNEGVVKASVAYQAGTFTNSSTSFGAIIGDGDFLPTISRSGGTSKSLLSQKLAPPKTGRNGSSCLGIIMIAFIGFIIAAFRGSNTIAMITTGVIVLGTWGFFSDYGTVEKKEKAAMADYLRTWFCPRCGYIGDEDNFEENKIPKGDGDLPVSLEKANEKQSFDVVLINNGNNDESIIKEIRSITGLGLIECKLLIDSGSFKIKSGISKEEAEATKQRLEDAGATVEIH